MLNKHSRLSKKEDFSRVLARRSVYQDKDFFIKALATRSMISRVGIIVNSKCIKRAVDRNRIKRSVRGLIRANQKNLKKDLDIVIFLQPKNIDTRSLKILRVNIQDALKKAKLSV